MSPRVAQARARIRARLREAGIACRETESIAELNESLKLAREFEELVELFGGLRRDEIAVRDAWNRARA